MSNPSKNSLLHVATIGRSVGLKGDMKFHIKSDFPEQFVNGARFLLKDGTSIELADVNAPRGTLRLKQCDSLEAAKRFTNVKLYTTYEATRDVCDLEDDEFFWFDVIGCRVIEAGVELGRVMEIDRINIYDYLVIKTDALLVKQGYNKSFLIPYQDPFIVKTDIDAKTIEVEGGVDLLEAS